MYNNYNIKNKINTYMNYIVLIIIIIYRAQICRTRINNNMPEK